MYMTFRSSADRPEAILAFEDSIPANSSTSYTEPTFEDNPEQCQDGLDGTCPAQCTNESGSELYQSGTQQYSYGNTGAGEIEGHAAWDAIVNIITSLWD